MRARARARVCVCVCVISCNLAVCKCACVYYRNTMFKMSVWVHLVFLLGVYDKLRTRYVQMSVWVHLVFVLGVYDKLKTRCVQMSVWVNLPDSDVIQDIGKFGCSESPGFGYGIYRVIDAREIGLVISVLMRFSRSQFVRARRARSA